MSMRKEIRQEYQELIEGYKRQVKERPHFTFKAYCEAKGLSYRKVLDWAGNRGIFVRDIKRGISKESKSFVQIVSRPKPSCSNQLYGIDISFVDGVSLHLERSGVEEIVTLLTAYKSRMMSKEGICSH